MAGLESDTIGGINDTLAENRKVKGECNVSLVQFNQDSEVVLDRVPIEKVKPLTNQDYRVGGCTALLDAVGGAIHHIGNVHKYAREEDVPEKTIFIITTDGKENASRAYSYAKVKQMIERQKEKYNWEFLFVGANIDAAEEGARIGIHASRTANYVHDREGTRVQYSALADAVSCARSATSAREMNAMFDEDKAMAPIREDFRKRGKKKR
jgi:uncharacterized protein YegL